ncbi:TRAP transporter large permease [Boseongicola aestuarii]|uniref:TRAP transporter large permease protein n=1 Tax=Boseongicola aestuarii TaxID=1470561 RepID=A0A238IZP9_9RHOB|nr:TRAP transporter large permease [Boseongicola aestuarii]SMX23958.1 Sialic acid TRAP transporter permease protein SiaT [Boseongicola aestuarii]
MTPMLAGLLGFGALFVLLAIRMPIGLAMMVVGASGIAVLNSPTAALNNMGSFAFSYSAVFTLSVIPLFVLMGAFASVSGMGADMYRAAYSFVGHRRGGLAAATIIACAGFAALSGSSIAAAATMGKVSLPEMERYKYSSRLATGSIAAGGTLGILIPPSTVLIVYALLTEQSVGRLFLAGFLPGLLLTLLFIATVFIVAIMNPDAGPPGERVAMKERFKTLFGSGALIFVVLIVIGGIYAGIFTVTEAAAVGAGLTFLHALWSRRLTIARFFEALLDTIKTTAMVFFILIGAHFFAPFLALTRIPVNLADWIGELAIPAFAILMVIIFVYIILGTFMEGFAMMVLTVPIVLPIITTLGYDPIWFGIIMVVVLEMGLISPPVGLNVFVVKGVAPHVPLSEVYWGILPFWLAMGVCVILLVAFPDIALFLPNTMLGR